MRMSVELNYENGKGPTWHVYVDPPRSCEAGCGTASTVLRIISVNWDLPAPWQPQRAPLFFKFDKLLGSPRELSRL